MNPPQGGRSGPRSYHSGCHWRSLVRALLDLGEQIMQLGRVLRTCVPILRHRPEGYSGKAVRGLGTGAIGQGIGSALAPNGLEAVRTRAGWAQLNVHPTTGMTVGSGAGMDDPEDDDLPPEGRRKNVTIEGHFVWRFSGPLLVGAEWRQTTTRYRADFSDTNHHANLAFGFVF